MLNSFTKSLLAVALVAGLSACASTQKPEDPALTDVRGKLVQAQNDVDLARYAPVELQEAEEAVETLACAVKCDAEDKDVAHLKYVAERRIQIAEARAMEARDRQAIAQLPARAEPTADQALDKFAEVLEAERTDRGVVLNFEGVQFGLNSAALTAQGRAAAQKIAEGLKAVPGARVVVEGHTDSSGSAAYNLTLSRKRANAVRDALIAAGVDGGRVTATGFGEDRPIADNGTKDGRVKNRRVEVVVNNN